MSYRDRPRRFPTNRQDDLDHDVEYPSPADAAMPPPPPEDETRQPWELDSSEVESYLTGRAERSSQRRQRPRLSERFDQFRPPPRTRQTASHPESPPAYPEPPYPDSMAPGAYDAAHGEGDPYAIPPARPDESDLGFPDGFGTDDNLGHDAESAPAAAARQARPAARPRRAARSRSARARRAARPATRPTMPRFLARADVVSDSTTLMLLGVAALGLALMAAVVANRLDALPEVIALRLDAAGLPDWVGSRDNLWHLPLLATVLTLMNLSAAWFLARYDRFASRFLLAAALVVQLLTWIAVFRFLW